MNLPIHPPQHQVAYFRLTHNPSSDIFTPAKSNFLSLLEMTGKTKNGKKMAQEILSSGKALEKFKEIIKAQKGSFKKLKPARFKKNILAKHSGKIAEIHNKKINNMARTAGCPVNKSAGLYLHHHVGDKVKKKDKILTIYAESRSRLRHAVRFNKKEKPIKIR